ncbi:cation channel sperm-associated protein 1 [Phacochoerus africanus]|uniref:cation channel sperm-associated protein 1 n=1 Tax=Phacochoerus africanus TaxID=41426 RepID=UPI001FD94EF8|nr:cation channel sperm-associated protein 1 [Phacochoerus africanus]
MAAKAQKEADTQGWDAFSRPGTSTPHHLAGQGRVRRPRESHHHRESHRDGRPHHPEAFQDFHDNASSHHSPHAPRGGGGEAHRQGGAHPSPSHGTVLSHQNYEEDPFDKEHRHGSRSHPRGPQHPKESHPSGGPHRPRESYHHGEFQHPSGFHHPGEPNHHKESPQPGAPHHSEASRHGGHHHHKAQHHGRSPVMGSYHQGLPPSHDEHHHGHRGHHGERHPRERHPKQRHHSVHPDGYLQGDPLYEAFHRGDSHLFDSHMFSSEGSASLGSSYFHSMALRPIEPEKKSSALTLVQSGGRVRAPSSQTSSRVHPQESSSKTSESWPEEDEQIQNRKTGRVPRPHKKLHPVDLCYCLWEKLSHILWGLQRMLRKLTESLAFEAFIVFIICLNTVMLVAQTFAEVEIRGEWYFMALDSIFLCIYVVEAVLKIIALGFKYFCDPWNNLDFFIMAMAVLDFTLLQLYSPSPTRAVYSLSVFRIFKVFKSLRALRAIRVLRRLSFLTSLQKVTGTLARSLPSITAILILMFTCLFLFSVVLRALFRHSDPKRFQSILTTIFTLFTLLTLDDWSLIYLDSRAQGAWYIVPILMIYIIIQYFIFLNLVIAVLVDNFQMALLKGLEKEKQEAAQIHEKLLDDSLTELIEAEPEEAMSEHTMQKQLIEKKFGSLTERQQELLFHFLQLVAGVEQYQQKFRSQASVIDEIVDTAFEAGEEDFRK